MTPARPKRRCTVCAIAGAKVLRFQLIRSVRLPDGRRSTRGCGRIDMCEECWRLAQRQVDKAGGHRRPRPRA